MALGGSFYKPAAGRSLGGDCGAQVFQRHQSRLGPRMFGGLTWRDHLRSQWLERVLRLSL